ncbi:MAG: lipopolysaccharide assembly protein LapA domain-containing protein [Candidatus Methylomirabilales bacterium]
MKLKTIVAVVLAALALVIFVQNTQVVTLRFLFWDLMMSRIILIPLFILIGFVLGYVVATMRGRR